jgi:hypothetical protein
MSIQPIISGLVMAAAALVTAAPVLAGPAEDGVPVTVSYGEELEAKFADTYGVREKEQVAQLVRQSVQRELPAGVARVEVEVLDVVPNRPTLGQMARTSGLSYSSFGIGGAEARGRAFDAAGNVMGETTYSWYSSDIIWAQTAWTWSDADKAFDRFGSRLADAITD